MRKGTIQTNSQNCAKLEQALTREQATLSTELQAATTEVDSLIHSLEHKRLKIEAQIAAAKEAKSQKLQSLKQRILENSKV